MSSQNNDNSAAAGLGVVVVLLAVLGMLVFAILAFVTFCLTCLSLCAWNKPLRVTSKLVIEPEEARAFVGRGLVGAGILPLFAIFCVLFFDIQIRSDWWVYIFAAGYIGGSLGVGVFQAQESANEAGGGIVVAPPQPPQPPSIPSQPQPQPERPPFRFASWDDEEELK